MIHVLRDCPITRDLWIMLIKPNFWLEFFRGDFTDWLLFNTKRNIGKLDNPNWQLTFWEAIRRLWLRRNNWIFRNEEYDIANLFWSIIMSAKELEDSLEALRFSGLVRREMFVSWNPPEVGWIKCNVDGSSRKGGAEAGCGGIFVIRRAFGSLASP